MKLLHSTPADNLPSIMQHGLLAYPDAIHVYGSDPGLKSEPDLIRPGVNLWHLKATEKGSELVHYHNDPHVVLEIDATKLQPGLLKNMDAIAGYGAWWRYFADIPVSAISVSRAPKFQSVGFFTTIPRSPACPCCRSALVVAPQPGTARWRRRKPDSI
jgi:hypothetical protein